MTIPTATATYIQIPGNGVATVFAFPFKLMQAADLIVGFITGGLYTQQSTGFTIQNVDTNGGGTVTFTTAPALGTTVDLRTQTAQIQNTEFANLGAYLPENTTEGLDRITRMVQDAYRQAYTFGIHGPDTEATPWTALPGASARANGALVFDPSGQPGIGVLLSTALTQPAFNAFLSAAWQFVLPTLQTPAEIAAGVTPTNYAYQPGDVRRYGTNTTAGITDMAPAIQAALSQAGQTGGAAAVLPTGTYAIGSPLTQPSGTTFIVQGNIITLGSFTPGAFMLNMGVADVNADTELDFQGGSFDGSFSGTTCIANGVDVICGRCRIIDPTIQHFPSYGVRFASALSGDSCIEGAPQIQQWNNSDAAYATQANLTADGVYFNRADCGMFGSGLGYVRWCRVPIHFGPSAHTCWAVNVHPYNGNGSSPFVDPVIIQADSTASSIEIRDCYLDNGHVDLYSPDVTITGCYALQGKSACLFSAGNETFIRVFANGQTDAYQVATNAFKNQYLASDNNPQSATATTLIGFYSFGGHSWSGTYAGLAALIPNLSFQNVHVTGGDVFIHNRSAGQGQPAGVYYKPSGTLDYTYQIGTGANPLMRSIGVSGGIGYENLTAQYSLLTHPTAATPAFWGVGPNSAGFGNDGNGAAVLRSNNTWRVVIDSSTGNMRPNVDNTYSCGTAGDRWSVIYAATGAINTSDERLKTEVRASELGLDFIRALKPVSYRWIHGGNEVEPVPESRDEHGNLIDNSGPGKVTAKPGTRRHFGLIAQQVKASLPEGLDFAGWTLGDKDDPDSQQGLRYDQFIAPLIKAVQELAERVRALEER